MSEILTKTANNRVQDLGLKQLQLTANSDSIHPISIFNPWQHKYIAVSIDVKNTTQSNIIVTVSGFKDLWVWEIAKGKFISTKL